MDLIYFKATVLGVLAFFPSWILNLLLLRLFFVLNGAELEESLTEKLSRDVGSRGEGTFVST